MKKAITKTMLLVMIAMVSIMMAAQIAKAGIANSKHDLSSGGPDATLKAANTDQVCVFCHTPHFSSNTVPLWNRSSPVTTSWTMYSSDTLRGTIQTAPVGVSLACLSCHDGATAFESLANLPGSGVNAVTGFTAETKKMSDKAGSNGLLLDGTNSLKNDHPISITYDTANGLKAITGAGAKGAKVGTLPLFGAGYNQVECATCHNVHDNATYGTFLRASNAASALCLTCHNK